MPSCNCSKTRVYHGRRAARDNYLGVATIGQGLQSWSLLNFVGQYCLSGASQNNWLLVFGACAIIAAQHLGTSFFPGDGGDTGISGFVSHQEETQKPEEWRCRRTRKKINVLSLRFFPDVLMHNTVTHRTSNASYTTFFVHRGEAQMPKIPQPTQTVACGGNKHLDVRSQDSKVVPYTTSGLLLRVAVNQVCKSSRWGS